MNIEKGDALLGGLIMEKATIKSFYATCKKIEVAQLRLDDCRIVAIINSLEEGSTIPLASASYTDATSNKGVLNTSITVDALKRISYVLLKEFNKFIEPIELADKNGFHTEYLIKCNPQQVTYESIIGGFKSEVLKGDIKRPSSAKSTTATASKVDTSAKSTTATASKVDNDKEEKLLSIVGKLSDIVKNRLKVSNAQLAELETAFMEVLTDNI